MALKIRLRQQGRNNQRSYRLVVIDTRKPRDGAYVEALGFYNPRGVKPEEIVQVKPDRAQHWLNVGAQPTEKVLILLKQAAPGVMQNYKAHLQTQRVKLQAKRKAARKRRVEKKKA